VVCGVVGGVKYDGVSKGRFSIYMAVLIFVGVHCTVMTR